MSIEPERPIEKLLRACGQKRRDEAGAPFALHPATRRLLQDEVSRRYAPAKSRPDLFSRVFQQYWPRLAWGFAVIAVGVALGAIFLPHLNRRQETLLAGSRVLPARLLASGFTFAYPDLEPALRHLLRRDGG